MSVSGDVECQEYLGRFRTAEAWVALNLTMSYPCSEGAFETPGRQLVSTDASAWQELPLGPGASVADAVRTPSGVLIVGHAAQMATIWLEAD
jgi:hypothetical protein